MDPTLVVKDIYIGAGVLGSILGQSNQTQCHERFATAATFFRSCVAQSPSREMGLATRYKPGAYPGGGPQTNAQNFRGVKNNLMA